jgi:AcrR family transcriptional regulator
LFSSKSAVGASELARLNKDQIAAAAVTVVDEKGLAGFTIRAVADALGASPMALYYHVKDKAELAKLVVSAVTREVPPPEATGVWRDDMLTMAHWSRNFATRHPAVSELHRVYPVTTPEIAKIAERWVRLWERSGLDRKAAQRAADISSIAIASLVVYVSQFQQIVPPDRKSPAGKSGATLLSQDVEDVYELVFAAIIDGLHASLGRRGRKRAGR